VWLLSYVAMQVLLVFGWILLWSPATSSHASLVNEIKVWWLPLNYLAYDFYLLAREGLSRRRGRSSFARSSETARDFLYLSPILMVVTTPFLGAAGTALHVALGLWAS